MEIVILCFAFLGQVGEADNNDSGVIAGIRRYREYFADPDGNIGYYEPIEHEIFFRLNDYKHCAIRYGEVVMVDWDNEPINFNYLRNGDFVEVYYYPGRPYWIGALKVRPRTVITFYDFSKINERWIAEAVEIRKISDIFRSDEIKLLNNLNSNSFTVRQRTMLQMQSMDISAVQKFLVHAPRFYKRSPEVLFRLNFLKLYFHDRMDTTYLPEKVYNYVLRLRQFFEYLYCPDVVVLAR